MKMLSMDSASFAQDLLDALGIKAGDKIQLSGPQFEQEDGITPIANPTDLFDKLTSFDEVTLVNLGMRRWDDAGLMLIPYQWYDYIPEGYDLTVISGETHKFKKGVTDNDRRYGMLAYGIYSNNKG